MFARIARAFRPLNTSRFDAAVDEALAEHHAVRVRARALRRDVSCGDPRAAIATIRTAASSAGDIFHRCFGAPEPTPQNMRSLLDRL